MKKSSRRIVSSKWLRRVIPLTLILVWLGLGAVGGPYFGRVEEVSEIDLVAFLPEGAEATQVSELAVDFRGDDSLPALVVFEADSKITDTSKDALEKFRKNIETDLAVVNEVSPTIISEDQKAALVSVSLDDDSDVGDAVSELSSLAHKAVSRENINSYVTGPAGFSADLNKAFAGIDGLLLGVALAVVFLILLAVYRSPVLPFVVLSTAVFALTAAIYIVWQLANVDIIQLNGQVQGILFILVIGAATDYSLLYVARYREELYQQKDKLKATLAAVKGSFEPILASGGTVIVGLLCLLLSELGSNQALGPVGSIGILMAMLAALTYLPSVLYLLGRGVFWPSVPRAGLISRAKHKQKIKRSIWTKLGQQVSDHPRRIWVGVGIGLLICAAGILQLNADGVAQDELIVGQSEARDGQKVLSRHFPDGSGSPALIIVSQDNYQELADKIDSDKGVSSVEAVSSDSPSGTIPLASSERQLRADIADKIEPKISKQKAQIDSRAQQIEMQYGQLAAEQFRVQAGSAVPTVGDLVDEAYPFASLQPTVQGDRVMLQATLTDDPNSDAAADTIERLRDKSHDISESALVGGVTATQLDTEEASIRDRTLIIPVVLLAITVILMLLLRSFIAPLLLLLTTVVSFASALGVAALLFNHVWNFPGADPSVVLYAFVFLVALGIDYNIFLMTRVREETLKIGTKKGVIRGLVVTGGVITSAGIVLAATFAALSVIPILFLLQLAFIVAFGVLLDTIIVRSLLVPALIHDLGSVVWWPSKLKTKK